MKIYRIHRTQTLPISADAAWRFFSNPANLPLITPPWLDFRMTSSAAGERVIAGQIITYRIRPVAGLPMNWVTEITHVREGESFVDEQRFGPYRFWHHRHLFEESDESVTVTDEVHYALPFGIFGRMAHALFVKRQLSRIFDYRQKVLDGLFANDGGGGTERRRTGSRRFSARTGMPTVSPAGRS